MWCLLCGFDKKMRAVDLAEGLLIHLFTAPGLLAASSQPVQIERVKIYFQTARQAYESKLPAPPRREMFQIYTILLISYTTLLSSVNTAQAARSLVCTREEVTLFPTILIFMFVSFIQLPSPSLSLSYIVRLYTT